MTAHRDAMTSALKEVFIPVLRADGFKGSLPHFRRVLPRRVDYLTVQYYSSGGSFVVELATAGPDGKPLGFGRDLPVEKLNTHFFRTRLRLGSNTAAGKDDHWYAFGPRGYADDIPLHPREHYVAVARAVLSDYQRQAEAWYQSDHGQPNAA